MISRTIRKVASLGIAVAIALMPATASATELEPYEFVTAPDGTTVFLGYALYGHHDQLVPAAGPALKDGTNLDLELGIARVAHYFNIGKTLALVEVLQPFGTLNKARIGGASLKRSSGLGDTILAAAVWPINDKERQTYFGVTLYLTVPTGEYYKLQTINLGGNRVVYDPQIALHQGMGEHWSTDLTADIIFYGDNEKAGALGQQTLSQRSSVQLQGFLNYKWTSGLTTSIGYQGYRGGRQRLDGVRNDLRTDFDEVRFVASKFIAPKFQLLGEINHQFDARGGFRQDFGFLLRGLYIF